MDREDDLIERINGLLRDLENNDALAAFMEQALEGVEVSPDAIIDPGTPDYVLEQMAADPFYLSRLGRMGGGLGVKPHHAQLPGYQA